MPASHSILFADKPSRSAAMMGIPPATAASKEMVTLFNCARRNSSLPNSAIKALLAVTTCFLFCSARSTSSLAMPVPPIVSTIMSIFESSATSKISALTLVSPVTQLRMGRRAPICVMLMLQPDRALIERLLRVRTLNVPPPTVPNPHMPTLMRFKMCSSKVL